MPAPLDGSIPSVMENTDPPSLSGRLRRSLAPPFRPALAAAVLIALLVSLMPDCYRSVAKVLPGNDRALPGLGQMTALAPMLGLGSLGQENDAVYGEVLTSWWLHQRLLAATFRYHERSWRFGPPVARVSTWRDYLRSPTLDGAVEASRERVRVRRDPKTRTLTLEVETRSAELSQAVVRRTLDLLDTFMMDMANSRGGNKARFAEARLEEATQALLQAEDALKTWFRQGHANYLTSADPLTRLEGAHLEGVLTLRKQQIVTLSTLHEQALLEEKSDLPTITVLDDGNLPERKSSPHRGLIVLIGFALVFLGDWLRRNHPLLRPRPGPAAGP